MNHSATKGFYKLCLSTLVAVYFLILIGGVVRTTGAGMGCPDWPKCFGQFVPPTSVDQLPVNYKEQYASIRDKKNQKFIGFLSAIGMHETASKIESDKSILIEDDFNPQKTWIEYVNRLVGVIIGFLIIAVFIRSISLFKINPFFFWISLSTLLIVIIQGWFGSIVVSTNLTSWTITLHMLLAIVIVALLILLIHKSSQGEISFVPVKVKILLVLCMFLLLTQIILGTEVRAAIDRVAESQEGRGKWISLIWSDFVVHRSFSWIVLLVHVIFILQLRKTNIKNALSLSLVLLILLTILTGAGMGYFSVPAFLQPVHLLVATVTFGLQLLLLLRLRINKEVILSN